MARFNLTSGVNNFTGTASGDLFIGDGGGADLLRGMGGNDRFSIQDWNNQRGRVDGGVGIDRIVMVGHNNHTFRTDLTIVGVEELYADEPNLFAMIKHLVVFSKFVPTGDDPFWVINVEGPGGTLDFTTSYSAAKRLTVDAFNATSRVIVTGSSKGDDFNGSDFNDVWIGGNGADSATGEFGNDIFRFKALSHSTVAAPDRILDFDMNGNDRIDVSALFGPALIFRGMQPFTGVGQLRIVDVAGPDVVVQVNTVGGLGADFAIRLVGVTAGMIAQDDFIL